MLAGLARLPLSLLARGKLDDAWAYAQAQIELFPNAVSFAVASLICFYRARHAEGEAKRRLVKEQLQCFERAHAEFPRLPSSHQHHAKIREVVEEGYEAAAFALYRAGELKAAKDMCAAAIEIDPHSPSAWTILGILMSGDTVAAGAFRKAVELGAQSYFPYSYLAHDALMKGEFREALDWSRQALDRGETQDVEVKSVLNQWAGISLANLDGPREEIDLFFKKAVELAPESEFARINYRHFRETGILEPTPPVPSIMDLDREILKIPDRDAGQVESSLGALAS